MRLAAFWTRRPAASLHRCAKSYALPRPGQSRNISQTTPLQGKRLSQTERDMLVRLRREGHTFPDIATALGTNRSEATISASYYLFCKAEGSYRHAGRTSLTDAQCEEISQMRRAKKTWREIALHFEMPLISLKHKYRRKAHDPVQRTARPWTAAEVQQLMHLRNDLRKPWLDVALHLCRHRASCQGRYNLVQLRGKPNRALNPDKYSEDELELLIHLREKQKLKWAEVAARMPGRTVASVSGRYSRMKVAEGNPIRRRKANFTVEEDQQLQKLHDTRGLSWIDVVKAMPERSAMALKARYYALARARASAPSSSSAYHSVGPKGQRSFSTASKLSTWAVTSARHCPVWMRTIWNQPTHRPVTLSSRNITNLHRSAHTNGGPSENLSKPKRSASRRTYSKEEDDLVLQRRKEGKHAYEIATELGRSLSSVAQRFRDLQERKLDAASIRKGSRFSNSEDELIMQGLRDSKNTRAIAAEMGRSARSVANRIQQIRPLRDAVGDATEPLFRRKASSPRFDPVDVDLILKERKTGSTFVAIASRLGTKPYSVSREYYRQIGVDNPQRKRNRREHLWIIISDSILSYHGSINGRLLL